MPTMNVDKLEKVKTVWNCKSDKDFNLDECVVQSIILAIMDGGSIELQIEREKKYVFTKNDLIAFIKEDCKTDA